MKVLVKANDDLISHCSCDTAYATNGQLDCPWCGCGWLFTCSTCRRAFTFARVVELAVPPDDERVYQGADLDFFEVGELALYLDGMLLGPRDADIDFAGYFARHVMPKLPHANAAQKSDLEVVFGDRSYWTTRALSGA